MLSVKDFMQLLKTTLLSLVVLILFSCGKQKAELNSSLVNSYDGKTTSSSCRGLDLTHNILRKESALKIFGCIGWKEEFPALNKYLVDLSDKDFDLIFSPLNKAFFENINKRNEFLKFIQQKVSKQEIKKIGQEIRTLLKDDVLMSTIFKLIQDLNFKLPSKDLFLNLIDLLKAISKTNNQKKHDVIDSIKKIESIEVGKNIFDNLKLSVLNQVVTPQSKFIGNIKNFLDPNSWPVNFLNKYNSKEIFSLITYASNQRKLNNDLASMQTTIELNLNNCYEFNSVYELSYEAEFEEQLRLLATTNKVTFLMDLFELSERFSLFNNICPYETFNQTSSRVLSHMRDYAIMPGGHELLKALANTSINQNELYLIFDMIKSKAFNLLAQMAVYDENSQSNLLKNTHNLLKEYRIKDFNKLSDALGLAGPEIREGKLAPFSKLTKLEKIHLADILLKDFLLEKDLFINVNLLSKFMNKYGGIYTSYQNEITENKIDYAFWIYGFSKKLDNKIFKDELIRFLDEDVFFKLISIISNDNTVVISSKSMDKETVIERKNEEIDAKEEDELIQCLAEFNQLSQRDYDFWYLLDNYPKTCISLVNQKSMTSYIFQWTLDIDKIFEDKVGERFSYKYGMIAPDMMSFYHSLIHIVNSHLDKSDGYINHVILNIRNELFKKGLMTILEDSTLLLDRVGNKSTIIEKTMQKIIESDPQKFDLTLKTLLKPIIFSESLSTLPDYSCKSANSQIGGVTCFSEADLNDFLQDISLFLIRDNGARKKLYESLVDFILGSKGVMIPFESRKQKKKKLDLDEVVRFLFDMTNEKTRKKITYETKNTTKQFYANRAERLEVVIREISFLNNFYGAFFMNTVSRAKKYYKKVKSMKKNVSVMNSAAGYFRRRGVFPEETKWAFRNIFESYSSLYELEQRHAQPDGGYRMYGDFIQSLLTMAVETSSYQSQKYSPLQKPKPNMVKKHNGMFITRITDFSLLSQAGQWLRTISGNDVISIVGSSNFKLINKKLQKLVSPKETKSLFEYILTHKNKDLILSDFSHFIFGLGDEERTNYLNLLWNGLKIISRGASNYDGDKFVPLLKLIVKNYDSLRDYELFNSDRETIKEIAEYVSKVEKLSDQELKLLLNAGVHFITSIDIVEFETLLKDKQFIDSISNLKRSLIKYLRTPDYNTGFLRSFLYDEQLSFIPLQQMMINTYVAQGDFLYFKNIIRVLSLKNSEQSNLEVALREVFDKKDDIVIKFLTDIFNKFYRPSIQ